MLRKHRRSSHVEDAHSSRLKATSKDLLGRMIGDGCGTFLGCCEVVQLREGHVNTSHAGIWLLGVLNSHVQLTTMPGVCRVGIAKSQHYMWHMEWRNSHLWKHDSKLSGTNYVTETQMPMDFCFEGWPYSIRVSFG